MAPRRSTQETVPATNTANNSEAKPKRNVRPRKVLATKKVDPKLAKMYVPVSAARKRVDSSA
ncbi:hypothetical protein Tdes44962_MAKER04359 [Teratosphaeria destructans]|uniref:Uncharacterized protein n=1 Tax=Teratosphaeria destructans TaxID=418781 RepID=A0A9W7SMT0_9PEZI|nr:hypothetical protein Tdes44962_MAKER04359 [Teratosphaeria destructans]